MSLQDLPLNGPVAGDEAPRVIVVGVDADQLSSDGSHPSLDAVAYAVRLSRRLDARLVPVWVRAPITMSDTFVETVPTLIAERLERTEKIQHTLETAVEGVPPGSLIVREGDPFEELTAVAREMNADSIVVGASEHRLGSLAVRLVRDAHWPVTVVP